MKKLFVVIFFFGLLYAQSVPLSKPILFVTTPPDGAFNNMLNSFNNHGSEWTAAPRGGDLWIMYPDGTRRNLTKEAGFGIDSGLVQTANGIAVRQPSMHWDGTKAVFSMIVGGPTKAWDITYIQNRWQIYEITGFGQGETPVITKVPNQPNYNNISPEYATDDQILFSSDAPLFNMAHTYPQRDEYETVRVVTGIWKLNPATGALSMIEHSPSGVFDLFVDSFGRVLFTKWDHLSRDQQADHDRFTPGANFGSVDIENELPNAQIKIYPETDKGKLIADARGTLYDIFPEAKHAQDPTRDNNESLVDFNQFVIWEVNEDGTAEETINHAGRHEFGGNYMNGSKKDDPNLTYIFTDHSQNHLRSTIVGSAGLFQLQEDPNKPGVYYSTFAHEFERMTSGRIIEFSMPTGMNPETMDMTDWTNSSLDSDPSGHSPATADMTGHYRNPLMLENGTMLVTHTNEYRANNSNAGILYKFQIKPMVKRFPNNPASKEHITGSPLTGNGIIKSIRWWNGGSISEYNGIMSEVDMVEVRARPRPVARTSPITTIEKQVMDEEGVDESQLRQWMKQENLALIVSRNVTLRDRADVSQPFNLRVPGGVMNTPKQGKVYDISHLQIFQGDLTRAYKTYDGKSLQPGRRVYVRPVHNSQHHPTIESVNPPSGGPSGSVKIGIDGSVAAFVPAVRALTWQTTDSTGVGIVRERNWISFAAGEIRTCTVCHGLNAQTHAGLSEPQNKPQALRSLLQYWKSTLLSVHGEKNSPTTFSLEQNYPNPFNPSTLIRYQIPVSSHVSLRVYDAIGREVAQLVDEVKEAGNYSANFNALKLTSGVYYYMIRAGKYTDAKKMLLLR